MHREKNLPQTTATEETRARDEALLKYSSPCPEIKTNDDRLRNVNFSWVETMLRLQGQKTTKLAYTGFCEGNNLLTYDVFVWENTCKMPVLFCYILNNSMTRLSEEQ